MGGSVSAIGMGHFVDQSADDSPVAPAKRKFAYCYLIAANPVGKPIIRVVRAVTYPDRIVVKAVVKRTPVGKGLKSVITGLDPLMLLLIMPIAFSSIGCWVRSAGVY